MLITNKHRSSFKFDGVTFTVLGVIPPLISPIGLYYLHFSKN